MIEYFIIGFCFRGLFHSMERSHPLFSLYAKNAPTWSYLLGYFVIWPLFWPLLVPLNAFGFWAFSQGEK